MELRGRARETESETLQRHMSTTMGCKVWNRVKEGEKGGKQSEEEKERMKTNAEHFDVKEESQVILVWRVHFCKL